MSDEGVLSDLSDHDTPPAGRHKLCNLAVSRDALERLRAKKKLLQCRLNHVRTHGAKAPWEEKCLTMCLSDLSAAIQATGTVLGRKPYGIQISETKMPTD